MDIHYTTKGRTYKQDFPTAAEAVREFGRLCRSRNIEEVRLIGPSGKIEKLFKLF